jgi:hypothetical protein
MLIRSPIFSSCVLSDRRVKIVRSGNERASLASTIQKFAACRFVIIDCLVAGYEFAAMGIAKFPAHIPLSAACLFCWLPCKISIAGASFRIQRRYFAAWARDGSTLLMYRFTIYCKITIGCYVLPLGEISVTFDRHTSPGAPRPIHMLENRSARGASICS